MVHIDLVQYKINNQQLPSMDVPEGNNSAKKITAENLSIELGGVNDQAPHQMSGSVAAAASGSTPKLIIYNQATFLQKIQYWLLVALSVGSLLSYCATVLSSFRIVTPQCNCTSASTLAPTWPK